MLWRCRDRTFDLAGRAIVMGVVNVTPDSFSDGGRFLDPAAAIARARSLFAEGAAVLDLGAESTRPGAEAVPADEQLRRLRPVIEALAGNGDAQLRHVGEVGQASLAAGARASQVTYTFP